MANPAHVVANLNEMFQMGSHGGLYLTIWYGVYDLSTRTLTYSSAGHHPSLLVPPEREEAVPLRLPNVAHRHHAERRDSAPASVDVAPGSSLYVFSDGVFEIDRPDGSLWNIEGPRPAHRRAPSPAWPRPQRLLDAVRARGARPGRSRTTSPWWSRPSPERL